MAKQAMVIIAALSKQPAKQGECVVGQLLFIFTIFDRQFQLKPTSAGRR